LGLVSATTAPFLSSQQGDFPPQGAEGLINTFTLELISATAIPVTLATKKRAANTSLGGLLRVMVVVPLATTASHYSDGDAA
jgi:hypothetical protein